MSDGELDMTTLIISICVVVPALIAISVCAIVYCTHRNRQQKPLRSINGPVFSSYEGRMNRQRISSYPYTIDSSRFERNFYETHRNRNSTNVFEQSPPSYEISINESSSSTRETLPPLQTISLSKDRSQKSGVLVPRVHSTLPPSYAEIFLHPND